MKHWRRAIVFAALAVAAAGLLYWAFRPTAIIVETATVASGRFDAVIDGDGRTRVRNRYIVSSPLGGRLLRLPVKVGDKVEAGTTLAVVLPNLPEMLDPRARRELDERIGAAEAALNEATAMVERLRAELTQAQADVQRARTLRQQSVISSQQLEQRELALSVAERSLRAAEFRQHMAEHELEQAKALQQRYDQPGNTEQWNVTAPAPGRVLRLLQESEISVRAGMPLIEIGDIGDLEIIVDLLTTDAVRVRPGNLVKIDHWGGPDTLEGRVRLIEPGAFTKLSALGVEEQRVWVVIDIVSPQQRWATLGDAYRVDVQINVQTIDNASMIPASALFRRGESWFVFVVEDNVAHEREVSVRARSDTQAAIGETLKSGERVVVFPPSTLRDGSRVAPR
jgi:HlyD family secretion protein